MSSIVLKASNEERFNKLWVDFAKTDDQNMRFSEFFNFCIDRGLLSNRITISHFYNLFAFCTKKD